MKAFRIIVPLAVMVLCWSGKPIRAEPEHLFNRDFFSLAGRPDVKALTNAAKASRTNNDPATFVNAFNAADPETQAAYLRLWVGIASNFPGMNPFVQALQDCAIGDCDHLTAYMMAPPNAISTGTPLPPVRPDPLDPQNPGSMTANAINSGANGGLPPADSSGSANVDQQLLVDFQYTLDPQTVASIAGRVSNATIDTQVALMKSLSGNEPEMQKLREAVGLCMLGDCNTFIGLVQNPQAGTAGSGTGGATAGNSGGTTDTGGAGTTNVGS